MFDAKRAIDNFRRRDAAIRQQWSRHATRLLERLPALAQRLRSEFGVTEIWLFGSLARGDHGPRSDVDLAVGGLARGKFWRASSVASQVLDCDVDLVPLEGAPASLHATLEAEGRRL